MTEKQSTFESILKVVEKLLVPVSLVVLGLLGYMSTKNINEAREADAQKQLQLQSNELETNKKLKYIEIFYQEIASDEEHRQHLALSLIKFLDHEIGQKITEWLATSTHLSQTIKDEAATIQASLETFGPLAGHKVGIYFVDKAPCRALAETIAKELKDAGFPAQVGLYAKQKEFFLKEPEGLEVVYDGASEQAAADVLESFLVERHDTMKVTKRLALGEWTKDLVAIYVDLDL